MDVRFFVPLAVPVAASLLIAALARPLADRLEPRLGTWLLTAAAATLAACTTIVLGLLAAGGAVRVPQVAWLGRMSVHMLRRGDPVPAPVALAATVVLAALAVSAARATRVHGRALAAAWRAARDLSGEGQLVVVDDRAVDAFAVPALGPLPGHVVVSTGMLAVLNENEQQILLAHERAHLAGHHYLFLLTSRLAAAASPLLIPVATAVAHTIERWADEKAAARTGQRRQAACAIGKAALARHGSRRITAAGWALHAATGSVPRRVAALLAPPARPRRWVAVAVIAILTAACLAALLPAEQLHELLKTARLGHH